MKQAQMARSEVLIGVLLAEIYASGTSLANIGGLSQQGFSKWWCKLLKRVFGVIDEVGCV